MIVDHRLIKHAIAAVERIYRQGGIGRIALPDPDTGELVVYVINQRAAGEIVAWGADRLIADLRRRRNRGEPLSVTEKEALRLWREKVPHAYNWGAVPGGPCFVTPLNASGQPIGSLDEVEVVLAAHPSEYDIGWRVPKTKRVLGFRGPIRLDGSHRRGRRYFVAHLTFPPGTGLLTAWTQFDHLNTERAVRRLSPEDQRRGLFPYGAATLPDGEKIVVFNWAYLPTCARTANSEHTRLRRTEEALRPPGRRAAAAGLGRGPRRRP